MDFKEFLVRYKPGASISTHLMLAALIWSVVGFFLMVNGFLLVSLAERSWLIFLGLTLGTAKGFFILDRVARKNIKRIHGFERKICIGSVYSYKTWLLVIMMIVVGRTLRLTVLPGEVVGVIYLAVGCGLMLSSRLMWLEWRRVS
ncbi:MAG: hypothetical protein IME97_08335 [Proteobacteria bacterium]|nr:hypothetical protein [Pseudomonadota bacterium]